MPIEKEHEVCMSLFVHVCCGYHISEFVRVCSSVDASAETFVSAVCVCVCVAAQSGWLQEKDHGCLCVLAVYVCVVGTTSVSLCGGAKCGCLCH